jgi:hypothetical protein
LRILDFPERCGDVSRCAGSQTNRFAPHGFIYVHNLAQQATVAVQFCGTARRIYAELVQAQFKLVERADRDPGQDRTH